MHDKNLKIYLDNNASTQCDPIISNKFQEVNCKNYGNPHSLEHSFGWNAERSIEESQKVIADFIGAFPHEIIFTSGATEANNLAIIGTGTTAKIKNIDKNKIIVSEIEHKCVLNSAYHLQTLFGFEVIIAPVNSHGVVNIDFLEKNIDKNTLLVSVMAANNEIGTYQPLKKIGTLCKKHDVMLHVDAAQAGYYPLDVIDMQIDLLSLSSHKLYGPKGIGILYISDDIALKPTPLIHGGGQQNNFRSGTLSPSLSLAMAEAVNIMSEKRDAEIIHLKKLQELFLHEVKKSNISFKINSTAKNIHPGNLNILFNNIDAKTLITRLQPKIAISTGSACNSGFIEPSYTLKAIGLSDTQAESSVRISFGRFNTIQEATISGQLIANEVIAMLS